jgi:hypothetical protein
MGHLDERNLLMRPTRLIPVCVAILLFAAAGLAFARVFWRVPAPAGVRGRLQQIGLNSVYAADVVLNGGAGYFEVGLLDGDPGVALRRLAQNPGAGDKQWLHQVGPQFASAASLDPEGFTRILAFALPERPQTLVFCLTQSRAEAALSARPPNTPPDGVTLFPYQALLTTWENRDTRTRAAVAEIDSDPATVRDFYRRHYRDTGWLEFPPALPGTESAHPSGLYIYSKGPELVLVAVQTRAPAQRQTLTVLHKTLGPEAQ